jgi:hypothetical protein
LTQRSCCCCNCFRQTGCNNYQKLNNPREDAAATAAATEFYKSTVATTKIKPQANSTTSSEKKQQQQQQQQAHKIQLLLLSQIKNIPVIFIRANQSYLKALSWLTLFVYEFFACQPSKPVLKCTWLSWQQKYTRSPPYSKHSEAESIDFN